MGRVILITGGARSGKSRYAEARVAAYPSPWAFLATAEAGDEEMAERIRLHQTRRSQEWRTVEAPLALVDALQETARFSGAQLVDCLTLWLSNLMQAERDVGAEMDRLCNYLTDTTTPVVLVTNEVGMGIVPANALARRFRDEAGRMNQAIAVVAQEVVLMVSGYPTTVKPALHSAL